MPTAHRIAQTSTEAKRQHKKNGPGIPVRQQKQLERGHELDQRAARLREAEQRRKIAKKKREEKEEQQRLLRQQQGIGQATQAIGYNHTQARSKNWMESFLGVDKRKAEAKRKRDMDLSKKMEEIANKLEKEPWDDDEVDDIALDLPNLNASIGKTWVDDDLDDNSLLEAHDLLTSDQPDQPLDNLQHAAVTGSPTVPSPPIRTLAIEDAAFVREHGYINRVVERVLDELPEPMLEFLSQDMSMRFPDWNPSLGLLHKLNPPSVPPHRLRVKVGCIVMLLRDLNSNSQSSKRRHLRILRVENERLECLVLDGQLEGTKTFLTRVPFLAKYKNQDQHLFRRTQFPIRVATDYPLSTLPRGITQSGFKLPSIPGRLPPISSVRTPPQPFPMVKTVVDMNPNFKMPGLPASKSTPSVPTKPIPRNRPTSHDPIVLLDGWDDFLETGTQIARELSAETIQPTTRSSSVPIAAPPAMIDCVPPLSTQDLDFSVDDLDDDSPIISAKCIPTPANRQCSTLQSPSAHMESKVKTESPATESMPPDSGRYTSSTLPTASDIVMKLAANSETVARPIDLSTLRASQRPPSVSDRPGLKRKTFTAPYSTFSKRRCTPSTRVSLPVKPTVARTPPDVQARNFMISTQEVASFFDDDDNVFGSPPIPV